MLLEPHRPRLRGAGKICKTSMVALENHLNYVYRPGGTLIYEFLEAEGYGYPLTTTRNPGNVG